jgi:hypothetical protein
MVSRLDVNPREPWLDQVETAVWKRLLPAPRPLL